MPFEPFPWPQPVYQVEIPYTFTNRTGARVTVTRYAPDGVDISLERRVGDEWHEVWVPIMNALGHGDGPIVLEPGDTYSTVVHIFGWPPRGNIGRSWTRREGRVGFSGREPILSSGPG